MHTMSLYNLGQRNTADSKVWQQPPTLIHHKSKQKDFFIRKTKESPEVLLA